jgi:hypothetical protein
VLSGLRVSKECLVSLSISVCLPGIFVATGLEVGGFPLVKPVIEVELGVKKGFKSAQIIVTITCDHITARTTSDATINWYHIGARMA